MNATKSIFRRWWFWVIVALIVFGIASNGNSKKAQVATAEAQSSEVSNAKSDSMTTENATLVEPMDTKPWINAGQYKVGVDIKEGDYVVFPDNEKYPYFEISKDSSGKMASMIANDSYHGVRYVNLSAGTYFTLKDSRMLPIEKCDPLTPTDGKYIAGMYKVGRDIKAGEYKVVPEPACDGYYEVVKDARYHFSGIEKNGTISSPVYVTLSDGQYIVLQDCYIAL